jgi:hypothetical protein
MSKKFRSFEDARKFVQSLNLKNQKEWYDYCVSNNKPHDIPSNPEKTYQNKGWTGLGDWLGTGRIVPKDRQYRSFEDARIFVQTLKLKNRPEWEKYSKSGNKPDDIPGNPRLTFKEGWTNWGDFLGTGRIQNQQIQYRTFEDARIFVQTLKLKRTKDWVDFCQTSEIPQDIPHSPEVVYKNKGWKNMGDWLGTGTIQSQQIQYRSFEDARKFVQNLGLRNHAEWKNYCNSGNKPKDIPSAPWQVYKKWNIERMVKNEKRV